MNAVHFQMIAGLAPMYYLATNPDVVKVYGTTPEGAVKHYEEYGKREGRSPNPFFDPRYYMGIHGDLQNAFGVENYARGLQHWIEYGVREGRRGAPAFHLKWYLDHHEDLQNAFGAENYARGFQHWLEFGNQEGRLTAPDHIVRLIGASRNDVFNVYVASASQQESPDFFAAVQNFTSSDDPEFFEPYNTTGGRIGFSVGVLIGLWFSGGNPGAALEVGLVGGLAGHSLDRIIVDITKITGPAWGDLEHSWVGEELGNFGGVLSDGWKDAGGTISDAWKKI